MIRFRDFSNAPLLLSVILLSTVFANAQTRLPVPATGLCNTGLTPKSPQPVGCLTSVPVTPVNPVDGGPSIDGNWELATPYPSVIYSAPAPNPCSFKTAYGPAFVNAPWYNWFNPDDQISQWIAPLGGGYDLAGWYIYRTALPVAAAYPGYSHYVLEISGQVLADNEDVAIYLENPANIVSTCREVATVAGANFSGWTQFQISTPVVPNTRGYFYVVVFNAPPDNTGNPTGLRLEWGSPYFFPY
jgi:hypothetical protein